jgi:hypothetical protein
MRMKQGRWQLAVEDAQRCIEVCLLNSKISPVLRTDYTHCTAQPHRRLSPSLIVASPLPQPCREPLQRDPSWVKGYLRMGAALRAGGRRDAAVGALSQGLKLSPGCEELQALLEQLTASDSTPQDASVKKEQV